MNNLIEFLKQEGVSAQLVEEVRHYSEEHTVDEALKKRIPVPHFHYYGNKVWEEALAVLLCGRNLLLAGEKATGKNVLAQNLAAVFERPAWDISFHVNMDAAALIGSDTFHDGRVTFRPGPCTVVHKVAALGFSMKSIWQGMKHLQSYILYLISDV